MRFALRAQPIHAGGGRGDVELAREVDAALIRDKIAYRQAIPTPEATFEELWQQLRIHLDARDA
jgi:hypothetical protein